MERALMRRKRERILAQLLFFGYMALLTYLLFFAEAAGRKTGYTEYHYNFIPFDTMRRYLVYGGTVGRNAVLINLLGNVLAFLPFGFFLPVIFQKCRRLWITVLLTALFSMTVEVIQLVTMVGSCDIDDLILNTLGGLLGYLLFLGYVRVRGRITERLDAVRQQSREESHA